MEPSDESIQTYLNESNNTDKSITIDYDTRTETLKVWNSNLIIYVYPIVILIGIVGNALSFIVLMNKSMRSRSVYFYLMLLSVVDTLVLFLDAFRMWFRTLTGKEIFMHNSDAGCKLFFFSFYSAQHMSAWLIVLLTFDRFLAVLYPLKAMIICTAKRAAIISSVCFLVIFAYQSHVFWAFHLQFIERGNNTTMPICAPFGKHTFWNRGRNSLILATYCVIPFILVLTLNILIIAKLNKKQFVDQKSTANMTAAERRSIQMSRTASADSEHRISRMTTVLFLVSFTWLILTLPYTLFNVLPMTVTKGTNPFTREVEKLVKFVVFIMLYLNHSINFFLYCLSGKRLRDVMYEQLCGIAVGFRERTKSQSSSLRNSTSVKIHQGVQGNDL